MERKIRKRILFEVKWIYIYFLQFLVAFGVVHFRIWFQIGCCLMMIFPFGWRRRRRTWRERRRSWWWWWFVCLRMFRDVAIIYERWIIRIVWIVIHEIIRVNIWIFASHFSFLFIYRLGECKWECGTEADWLSDCQNMTDVNEIVCLFKMHFSFVEEWNENK